MRCNSGERARRAQPQPAVWFGLCMLLLVGIPSLQTTQLLYAARLAEEIVSRVQYINYTSTSVFSEQGYGNDILRSDHLAFMQGIEQYFRQ